MIVTGGLGTPRLCNCSLPCNYSVADWAKLVERLSAFVDNTAGLDSGSIVYSFPRTFCTFYGFGHCYRSATLFF
jgi:hypothetical protein